MSTTPRPKYNLKTILKTIADLQSWIRRRPQSVQNIDQGLKLNRSEYKRIWDSVARTEGAAKMAVSGYVDESLYDSTGAGTRDMLLNTVGIKPSDTVLEIGAGVGRVGKFLAPICHKWIGVDVSENMLTYAERRLATFDNVKLVASNGYDLDQVASESVDVIYSTVVFMHLDEWDRFNYVQEGFRVLKPGGRLLVDNIDLTSDDGWKLFLDHRSIPPNERPAQISKTSTPQELETYFVRSGFTEVKQVRAGLWIITYGTKPKL